MSANNPAGKTPAWMTILIIICSLPIFSLPALLTNCPAELRAMVWLYPAYVVAAAWLAWQTYPSRRALSWILVTLMVLSHAAVWMMVTSPLHT